MGHDYGSLHLVFGAGAIPGRYTVTETYFKGPITGYIHRPVYVRIKIQT